MIDIAVCNASDIKQLNETKKYTLLATDLINVLLLNPKLSSGAVKLWQFLYSKASPDTTLKFSITYAMLSKAFSKSIRTIQRYIANLEQNGYVVIQENFDKGNQLANTFHLCFPQHEIDILKASKDRFKTKISSEDKNVIPRGDNSDVHNTTSLSTNENNNSNNVVVPCGENNFLEQQKYLTEIEQHKLKILEIWNGARSNNASNEQISEIWVQYCELETGYEIAKSKLEVLEKTSKLQTQKAVETENFRTNPRYTLELPGQRNLPEFTYKRLDKELEKLGFKEPEKTQILNEIVFEVRFGSLVKSNQSQQELSLDYAINIALKLVKTQRWSTPTGIKQNLLVSAK